MDLRRDRRPSGHSHIGATQWASFFCFFLRTDDDVHATIREAVAALNVPIGDPDPSKPRLRPMASSEKAKRMLKLQDFRSIGIIARDFMESLRERGFS